VRLIRISLLSQSNRQTGFTLITAIFLLVVVATLSVYILNLRNVQQQTLVFGVQGARAMQAARTGIEWGVNRSLEADNCPTTDLVFTALDDAALSAFTITVTCTESAHIEGSTDIKTFQLRAVAQTGNYGTLDYVSRLMEASVSEPPP
jgi:MSHA biogenesis protein MshP